MDDATWQGQVAIITGGADGLDYGVGEAGVLLGSLRGLRIARFHPQGQAGDVRLRRDLPHPLHHDALGGGRRRGGGRLQGERRQRRDGRQSNQRRRGSSDGNAPMLRISFHCSNSFGPFVSRRIAMSSSRNAPVKQNTIYTSEGVTIRLLRSMSSVTGMYGFSHSGRNSSTTR